MISPEDFKYIGLERVKNNDPNIPKYEGQINGTKFTFKILGKGHVEMTKGGKVTEFKGFTKASLLDVTGFKEPHEKLTKKAEPKPVAENKTEPKAESKPKPKPKRKPRKKAATKPKKDEV